MEQIDAEIAEITEKKQDGREEDEDHRETGNKEENEKEDDGNKGGGNVIVVSADEAGTWHEAIIRRAWCKKCAQMRIRSTGSGSPRSTSCFSTNRTGGWISCDWSGATPTTS